MGMLLGQQCQRVFKKVNNPSERPSVQTGEKHRTSADPDHWIYGRDLLPLAGRPSVEEDTEGEDLPERERVLLERRRFCED